MMNIRSRDVVADRLWDWGPLNGAFDRGVRPCDLDGIVEVNGFFLVMEAKPHDSLPPDGGQRRLLESLASMPNFTVLVLYGDPGSGIAVRWQRIGTRANSQPCTMEEVVAFVAHWYAMARGRIGVAS